MDDVNLTAVLVAAIAMFMAGGLWYGFIFGQQWGKIHGFDKLSAAKQKQMQSQMTMPYVGQFILTFITAWVLAYAIAKLSDVYIWTLGFFVWLGFLLPTQYSDLTFGGSPEGQFRQKFSIAAVGSLFTTLVGVWVLSLF